jgi:hypothetical protein
MTDERYCRRERRKFAAEAFTREDGRYIHEVPGNRHYIDGEQWYERGDPQGRVISPDVNERPDRDLNS